MSDNNTNEITEISSEKNNSVDWGLFFKEVTTELAKKEIKPGYLNPVCKSVNEYISYRNDKNPKYFNDNQTSTKKEEKTEIKSMKLDVYKLTEGHKAKAYLECDEAVDYKENAYNPCQDKDPFEAIKIEKITDYEIKKREEFVESNDDENTNYCKRCCCNIF